MGTTNGAQVGAQHLLPCVAQAGLDAQKKSCLYRERNEEQRLRYHEQLNCIAPEDRVYIDEAGVDDTLNYAYGWSRQGTRCYGEKLGHRTCRVSMAAALCCGHVLSPLTFEGYCDAPLIESWFEQHLLRELRPGQTVILDNASFHNHEALSAISATKDCLLLPLPSYSPD